MNKNIALIVSGIVFGMSSLIHLYRLIYQFDLIVAGYSIPLWVNGLGFVVALVLSLWMFMATTK
jgi:hypothetical protein